MFFNRSTLEWKILIHRELQRRSRIGAFNVFMAFLALNLAIHTDLNFSYSDYAWGGVFFSLALVRFSLGYLFTKVNQRNFKVWRICFYTVLFTSSLLWGIFVSTTFSKNGLGYNGTLTILATLFLAIEAIVTLSASYTFFSVNLSLLTFAPLGALSLHIGPTYFTNLGFYLFFYFVLLVAGRIVNLDILARIRKTAIINQQKIELESTREKAIEASKVKSQFLANISHELRSPMNVIIGMAGLLTDKGQDSDSRQLIDAIRASAEGLLSSINDILDFSKIEYGKLNLEEHPFELVECLESVFMRFQSKAEAKGLKLSYSLAANLPLIIVGDIVRVRQVLVNLLNNSIKFTEKGYIKIIVTKEKESDASGNSIIQFAVEDTGIGIPENRLVRLFKSFSQIDASTARKFGGSGLGLAISKRLCEMMGGKIWVNSRFGYGSTFYFTILAKPAVTESAVKVNSFETTGSIQIGDPHNLEILIAEDSVINQQILTKMLNKINYSADLATNGYEAIEAIKKKFYDVVFMDVQMPELSGLEATRIICDTWTKDNRPRIIAMTANVMTEDRQRCFEAGMDEFLGKPIRMKDLERILRACPKRDASAHLRTVHKTESPNGDGEMTIDYIQMLRIVGGDKELLYNSIETFSQESESMLNKLDLYIEDKEGELVEQTAQMIKQRASTFIATSVIRMALEIERAAQKLDFDSCARISKHLRPEIMSLIAILNEVKKTHKAA